MIMVRSIKRRLLVTLVSLVKFMCTISAVDVQPIPSKMGLCDPRRDERSSDCSFQINNAAVNSCLIYPTSVCRSSHYDAARPPKKLVNEHEAAFSIGLQPYNYIFPNLTNTLSSALNITLMSSHSDVFGFVVMLQQNAYNNCRIFDFSTARKASKNLIISLYYDCYRVLQFDGNLQYNLIVRSLPNNEELHYTILIEKITDSVEPSKRSGCTKDHIHVLYMNKGSLLENRAEVKYVSVPPLTDVTGIRLRLRSNTGLEKVADLTASQNAHDPFTATFEDLHGGRYNITPEFVSLKDCGSWSPLEFVLMTSDDYNDKPQWIFITIVFGVVVAVILIFVLLGSLCYHLHTPSGIQDILLEPPVLILYSYDCPKHHDVILKLASYLKTRCKVRVVLDGWETVGDPKKWLFTAIEENNLILLVLSRGVFHKCKEGKKSLMKEGTITQDLFTPAIIPLCHKLGSPGCTTKFMKILFDYTDRSLEPPCFKNLGPHTFHLPSQLTPFLCELHNIKKLNSFPIRVFPRMPGDDLEASSEGKVLSEAIANMQSYQKQNPHWFQEMLVECGTGRSSDPASDSTKPLLHSNPINVEMKES